MKVFLDTNVLVAAFATRGLCADLLRLVLAEHDLLLGERTLAELRRALRSKIGLPVAEVDDIEEFLRGRASIVVEVAAPAPLAGVKDTDDAWIVAEAKAAGADLLATGDAELRRAKKPPLPIVTPRDLWHRLATR